MKKIDITRHELVPKHEILSEKEKKELLERYKCELKHLPKILDSDPVVKALNAKPGDVIRIIRKEPMIGKSIYYRVVVKHK